jgi:hypothetical protein
MECTIPRPLQVEHEKLHAELVKATTMESKVGEAARTVAALLHPHFVKETEEYALPPLGLLPLLATGQVTPEMRDVLSMIDRLRTELPQMLNEHKTIMATLHQLVAAAKSENQMEDACFAEKLMLHAQTEEEVFYPTAILIKEYLKLKLDM